MLYDIVCVLATLYIVLFVIVCIFYAFMFFMGYLLSGGKIGNDMGYMFVLGSAFSTTNYIITNPSQVWTYISTISLPPNKIINKSPKENVVITL